MTSHSRRRRDRGGLSAGAWQALRGGGGAVAMDVGEDRGLQVVDELAYLGRTLSGFVHIDDEVNAEVAKAGAAFGRLRVGVRDRG